MENETVTLKIRNIATLVLFLIGAILVGISLSAEIIGLNLTSGFGIVQMAQLLVGLTFLTLSGFFRIQTLRLPDAPRSLQADIGVRFAATGLVACYAAGLADILQIGTHIEECVEVVTQTCGPFVGPFQLGGLILGILSIISGILLYYTSRGTRPASLLSFLIRNEAVESS